MIGLESWWAWLSRQTDRPRHRLVLQLTLVIFLLHGLDHWTWTMLPEKLLAATALVRPKLQGSRWLWLGISLSLIVNNLWHWSRLVNHEYLYTYWALACTLAIFSRRSQMILHYHGRCLIGLCFLFATLWKLIGGEYLDGSFLHATFLLDARLAMGAVGMGGLDLETLDQNRQIFSALQSSGPTAPAALLSSTGRMALVSQILSYWTILIEGSVAASFLLPWSRLSGIRDWLLLGFIVTTYAVIPVLGFGALLVVMGIAQVKSSRLANIYLGSLVLMPLWMPLPQGIFWLIQQIA